MSKLNIFLVIMCAGIFPYGAHAQLSQPNILFIMADDVGEDKISVYHRGRMGGSTIIEREE